MKESYHPFKSEKARETYLAYYDGHARCWPIAANIGEGVSGVLQSPQPPAVESILTALLNEITTIPDNFTVVLDDLPHY